MSDIEANYAKFEAAMAEFGEKNLTLFLDQRIAKHRHLDSSISRSWNVAVVGDGNFCEQVERPDFDAALAMLVEKVRGAPPRCGICGGRMDGPCKHSH